MPVRVLMLRAPALTSWSRRIGLAADSAPDSGISWRLLGANNRELGRGVGRGLAQDVLEHFERVRSGRAELVVSHLPDETGRWHWRGQLTDGVVVTSARLYSRKRESIRSATRFLEALASADLTVPVPLVERERS